MTSVFCERMQSDIKTKSNNFALVERYINLVKSVEEGGSDCFTAMMGVSDQEVPVSSFCMNQIKAEVEDEEEPQLIPDTPTILCDLSSYLPSESILHPAYDSNGNNSNNNNRNNNNNNSSSNSAPDTSTTVINISTYNSINIPTPVYRDCQMPVQEPSRKPENIFSFKETSAAVTAPFSPYLPSISPCLKQQQNHHHHQNQHILSSSSSSSLSSTSSASSQSPFWPMSSQSSLSSPVSSPSSSSSLSSSLHRQIGSSYSSSLSSFKLLSSPSSTASPLLSSPPTSAKPKTFISELTGSGCTVLSGTPNFLDGTCYEGITAGDVMTPGRSPDECLEYTDLDSKLPEISFYDDLTSMGSNEAGVPLQVMVDLMRDAIEKDRSELSLPHNPHHWSTMDVSRWLGWACRKHNVADISGQLESCSGAALCSWSSQTFVSLFGPSGSRVFQELDLWKTANIYNCTAIDNPSTNLAPPFMDPIQIIPSPSISPAPSHGSHTSNYSNNSHDSHQMVPSCIDTSEDDVFYQDNDIKMETETPASTVNKTVSTSDNLPKFKGHLFKQRLGRGHKKAITLWQFLLELLIGEEDHSDCIKWLNKETRVFKIEDSKKVASMWGRVKSRPAMNYDKLSRSVRQYYRKGIIKKPEQTKRLVYQFCQDVC